ncbi:copper chaperone PCu(A)C [Roseospira marina]|nr:copper chaperone PCu(A)C [Roseospira marina]MBB5087310.1 hypothetical protein [Roseospira marina]
MSRALAIVMLTTAPALAAEDHHDPAGSASDDHGVHAHDHETGVAHAFALGPLRVVHPWTRATQGPDAVVFMDLDNTGDAPITLTGAAADWAASAAIVGFTLKDGEGRYTPLPSIPIAPGHDLVLRPDEVALRFTGITAPLPHGGHVHLTLHTSLGALEIAAMVEAADALQHSHAGHSHMEHGD